MIVLFDDDASGRPGHLALELPAFGRDARREMMGNDVRGRFDKETGRWFVSKDRYRALWRFLQHRFPEEEVSGPLGNFQIDSTPGVSSSMGLQIERPAWFRGDS